MHVREMREIFVPEQDKYLILDIQGGQEDVLALVAALKLAHHYDRVVLGITCVAGRRKLEESVRDALLAQQIAGTKFPVYKGTR
jgi:inosine-uridine nucleoside N-ribohydrolase